MQPDNTCRYWELLHNRELHRKSPRKFHPFPRYLTSGSVRSGRSSNRMANKTTSSPKSQEQSTKTVIQSQLARIKKEEEEELWISGEELYTEGSSDEEECKTQSRSHHKINSNQSLSISSPSRNIERRNPSPVPDATKIRLEQSIGTFKDSITENESASECVPKSDKTSSENVHRTLPMECPRRDRLPVVGSSASSIAKDSSVFPVEEEQTEDIAFSWKAKRGSFMLPNRSNDTKEETNKCWHFGERVLSLSHSYRRAWWFENDNSARPQPLPIVLRVLTQTIFSLKLFFTLFHLTRLLLRIPTFYFYSTVSHYVYVYYFDTDDCS